MKKNRNKAFLFNIPILIDLMCILILIYGLTRKYDKEVFILVGIGSVLVNIYIIVKFHGFIKDFVNAIEQDMGKVIKDVKLDYKNCFQDSTYSRLYEKLFRIQENKKVHIEKQEQEMGVIHQLISDISHQVKTPIATAKTYSQILVRTPKADINEKQNEYIKIIYSQINKLDFLMQELIKMSRLETNIIILKPDEYCLENILAEAYAGVLLLAEKKNIEIQANYKGKHIVYIDYKWTIEAVGNILDNAVKYTDSEGIIKVEIVDSENYQIVKIIDNGCGIEETKIPLIFQRFYREEKAREIEGLGLGLSLSRRIIEKEQGYIRVESILNKGSTFLIYLPKAGGTK